MDWLGSTRLSSNVANRTVNSDRAFAPFGEKYNNFGSPENDSFAGDTQDAISGTYDTPNRELNPTQGRWLSPDPAGLSVVNPSNPQTWNRYAYVVNNPLAMIDPSGLGPLFCHTSSAAEFVCHDGSTDIISTQTLGLTFPVYGWVPPNLDWTDVSHTIDFGNGGGDASLGTSQALLSGGGWQITGYTTVPVLMNASISGPSNWSWVKNFVKSLVTSPLPSRGPGSCLGVFTSAIQDPLKSTKSAVENARKYAAPVVAALPAAGASAQALIYSTVQWGADPVNAGMMGDAIATGTAYVSAWAAAALAKVPTAAMFAVDGTLLYGVIQEGKAAVNGQCTP